MNDLENYFVSNPGRQIFKLHHYFEIYERHFSRFRGTDVHVVEFGVSQGGSLEMWRYYFGPKARIFGIDINPHCKMAEGPQIQVLIGDQEDRVFLRRLAGDIPRMDILIDDGGHTMNQQITTYEELFPHVSSEGVYLCEDLHTSYWAEYGGGYKRPGTFIEYSKGLVDLLNAWHSAKPRRFHATEFTRSVRALHYYDSVLVIEKRPVTKPTSAKTGQANVPDFVPPRKSSSERLRGRIKLEVARRRWGSRPQDSVP
jgi:hypothetical protein